MDSAARLAGYLTAHAVWSIAGGDGPLIPIVGRQPADGEVSITRMVVDDDPAAQVRELLGRPEQAPTAMAAVLDAFVTLDDVRYDALVTRFVQHPGGAQVEVVLPYTPGTGPANDLDAAHGFRVHRPQVTDRPADLTDDDIAALFQDFWAGVDSHPQGGGIWNAHLDDSVPPQSPRAQPTTVPTTYERYRDHLAELTGGAEPLLWQLPQERSASPDLPPVSVLLFEDWPEPGLMSLFSYGLSAADHPDRERIRPELCLTVRSDDRDFGIALAWVIDADRTRRPFDRGDVHSFGDQPIAAASQMTAVVVADPIPVPADRRQLDLGDTRIEIAGAYPVHADEGAFIQTRGLDAFAGLGWDPYDITRPSLITPSLITPNQITPSLIPPDLGIDPSSIEEPRRSPDADLERSRTDRFLAQLDRITGGAPLLVSDLDDSRKPDLPPAAGLFCTDWPAPGLLTVFSYGLSLADHAAWGTERREVCLTVRSDDTGWAFAVAFLIDQERGELAFDRGELATLGGPITEQTAMSDFVISDPVPLRPEQSVVALDGDRPVRFVGLYPLHRSETEFIDQHGLDAFRRLGWDPYDIGRAPLR